MKLFEQACENGEITHLGQRYTVTGEFRDPNHGEWFIDASGTTVIGPAAGGDGGWGHRIILRLVPGFSSQKRQGLLQAAESIRIGLDVLMRELK